MRSPHRRSSFAFASVVRTASCSRSSVTRLRSSARRCAGERPSFFPAARCRMSAGLALAGQAPAVELLARREVLQPHAEAQTHLVEDLLDLVQRLAAEVLGFEHLLLGLLDQLAEIADVGVLEAVRRAYAELEILDRPVEVFVEGSLAARLTLRTHRLFLEVHEDAELVLQDPGGVGDRVLRP